MSVAAQYYMKRRQIASAYADQLFSSTESKLSIERLHSDQPTDVQL